MSGEEMVPRRILAFALVLDGMVRKTVAQVELP